MTFYAAASLATIYFLIVMILNLGMLWLYTRINRRYWAEHTQLFKHFSTFIRDKIDPDEMPQNEMFIENTELLSLFKRTYVETKILKKDYTDFKNVFDTFIPREIHQTIWFRGYERIVLWTAARKKLTIMFLDIMKFTSVSETISDPYRALLLLNIYFDGIGEIIYSHHWYIDKYLGDGMLAIFDCANTDDAVHAAIEIQEFIRKFQISTVGRYIDIGIGINTWSVIVGTIGTKRRMDATVIGDVVNTASRIEWLTRDNPYHIIITRDTLDSLKNKKIFSFHDLGETELRWKNTQIPLYWVDAFERVELPDGSNE